MIYRVRIILDAPDDVLRDIEIDSDATAEELHNVITQAFGFEGGEMASFYESDEEWNQGDEIALFDMDEEGSDIRIMCETSLDDILSDDTPNLLYVYDFLNMWSFLIELVEISEPQIEENYPNVIFAQGLLPESPPDKDFIGEDKDQDGMDYEDHSSEDDYSESSYDNYDDLFE